MKDKLVDRGAFLHIYHCQTHPYWSPLGHPVQFNLSTAAQLSLYLSQKSPSPCFDVEILSLSLFHSVQINFCKYDNFEGRHSKRKKETEIERERERDRE